MKKSKKMLCFVVALMTAILTVFTSNTQAAKLYKEDAAKYRRVMNHYKRESPYSNIGYISKFTLYDLNRDGRKDLIMSPCDPSQASSEPMSTYVVMKIGKKYVSKKLNGEFVKAGSRSLLLEYSVKTYGKESIVKGVGHLDRKTLFKISKKGEFFLVAEYRHEIDNFTDASYTTSYNDGKGNNIGAAKYNEFIKKAKLSQLSFKKMTSANVKKVR